MKSSVEVKIKHLNLVNKLIADLRKNPQLKLLSLELTTRCNLKCTHCGSSCGQSIGDFIDTNTLLDALTYIKEDMDTSQIMVGLTGGEPMLHPDFMKILEHAANCGFNLGLVTNATLITEEDLKEFKRIGLKAVTISLDGLQESHDNLRGVAGCFDKTVNAIKLIHSYGLKTQVTTVVHKNNIGELDSIYNYIKDLGVFSWKVTNIEPIGRAIDNKDLLLSREELIYLVKYIQNKRINTNHIMDVTFACSHYLTPELEYESRSTYFMCGSGIISASILVNGDIYSCLDIERRSELIQGNISKDRFSDVWFNKFKEFRVDRSSKCKECKECPDRAFCQGDSTHTWDFENNKPKICILGRIDNEKSN